MGSPTTTARTAAKSKVVASAKGCAHLGWIVSREGRRPASNVTTRIPCCPCRSTCTRILRPALCTRRDISICGWASIQSSYTRTPSTPSRPCPLFPQIQHTGSAAANGCSRRGATSVTHCRSSNRKVHCSSTQRNCCSRCCCNCPPCRIRQLWPGAPAEISPGQQGQFPLLPQPRHE